MFRSPKKFDARNIGISIHFTKTFFNFFKIYPLTIGFVVMRQRLTSVIYNASKLRRRGVPFKSELSFIHFWDIYCSVLSRFYGLRGVLYERLDIDADRTLITRLERIEERVGLKWFGLRENEGFQKQHKQPDCVACGYLRLRLSRSTRVEGVYDTRETKVQKKQQSSNEGVWVLKVSD